MREDPKTADGTVLDPEERLDLLLSHLGSRREGLSKREAAAVSSSTVRTRSCADRAPAA
jgi:hypothetical protein